MLAREAAGWRAPFETAPEGMVPPQGEQGEAYDLGEIHRLP